LGEYGGDALPTKLGFIIKKPDSIFKIGENIFVAPVIHANWATLMNHSKK
jgi:hypothetical protein